MPERSAREVYDRLVAAMNTQDWDALRALHHPDFVQEYPQSGERIRGVENFIATLKNYPGGLDAGTNEPLAVMGPPEGWVMTPGFTVLKVTGGSDVYTIIIRVSYPDGSTWFVINFSRLKDGLIWRETAYFAPVFDAPEWRRQWVEIDERAGA